MNRVVSTVGGLATLSLLAACVSACGDSGGTGGAGGVGGAGVTNVTSVTSVTHVTSATVATNASTATHATSVDATVTAVGSTTNATTTTTTTTNATSSTATTTTGTTASSTVSTTASTGTGGGPPATWTCTASYYGGSDGCDCGCGAVDPDCTDATFASCEDCVDVGSCGTTDCFGADHGNINPTNNATCVPNTPENTAAACSDHVDNDYDGDVDCQDSDCAGQAICTPPATWMCDAASYGDGFCDCGCGAQDIDCSDNLGATCDNCNDTGSCAEAGFDCSFINPTNATTCLPPTPENTDAACSDGLDNDQDGHSDCDDSDCLGHAACAPTSWTCSPSYWNASDGCDCGCGALDPDCATNTVAACNDCQDPNSCGNALCPGNIKPTDIAHCN